MGYNNAMNQQVLLYSIGHSNHSFDRFAELLQSHKIQAIADVRSSPFSRHNPQFSKDELERNLKLQSIAYVFLGKELGARRDEPECYMGGKVVYDQVVKTDAFQRGLQRLVEGASKMRVAMLCAEGDPLTCHRSILIGRHIVQFVDEVVHILPNGNIETQVEAEQRLLEECELQHEDLFLTRNDRILEAYQRRGECIAYEEPILNG
jgi:uncharacterized protein (DUF488 family)